MRFLTLGFGLLLSLTSAGFATPDWIVVTNERFFGSGKDTYAVLRTVNDNKASHYERRFTTTLIERSSEDSSVVREVLMLDQTATLDVGYSGPGKLPVDVVTQAKDGNETLGNLLEKWPGQGFPISQEELDRFKIRDANVYFDGRCGLLRNKPAFDEWFKLAPKEAIWKIAEGIELSDTILLKLSWRAELGESHSSTLWVCVNDRMSAQVRAFRHIQPVYLVAGTYNSKEKALEQVSKWIEEAKAKGHYSYRFDVWEVDRNRSTPEYVIGMEDSKYLIDSGKTTEVEAHLNVHLVPRSNSRFREWIPIPGQ